MDEAMNLIEGVLDTLCEVGNGVTEEHLKQAASELFAARDLLDKMKDTQPESHDKRTETHACDLIERQAAIDALDEIEAEVADGYGYQYAKWREYFAKMQSAQPDIIRCRNCKFASGDSRICMKFDHSPIGELDFCAWAERRTDEE